MRLIEVKEAFLQVITSVSNWAPNMSIGPPLAKDGLCFSSQALKQYGDITFMVFISNGASLAISAVCSKVVCDKLDTT